MRYTSAGAKISADGRYRYLLWREWRGTHDPKNWTWIDEGEGIGEPKPCLFIMLNPSTATGEQDDATIRRCVSFAASWRFERLEVVNLFAHRATNPEELLALGWQDDPVGPENMTWVRSAAERAGLIVCGWGSHGGHLDQAETVLGWLSWRPRFALGFTVGGQPRHPLYVRSGTPLVEMDLGVLEGIATGGEVEDDDENDEAECEGAED